MPGVTCKIKVARYRCIQLMDTNMPAKYNAGDQKLGIHLVSSQPARRQERRLTVGGYTADIAVSKRGKNCCYYVLQRIGSAEILDMQKFNTPEEAEDAASRALERWNRDDLLRKTAS